MRDFENRSKISIVSSRYLLFNVEERERERKKRDKNSRDRCYERGKRCGFIGHIFSPLVPLFWLPRDSTLAYFCNLCTLKRACVTSLTTSRNFLPGFRQTGK